MITVISRFRVRNGLEEEVRQAFLNRPHLVEKAAGFCGLDVLTDSSDPSVFLLVTRWTDESSFRTWHRSEAHHWSHQLMPKGLKLDASFTSLTIGTSIQASPGIVRTSEVIQRQTGVLSTWLMNSDAVFALMLTPDGVIHARNRAADTIFPFDPAKGLGMRIWDYVVCSDHDRLRERLSGADGEDGSQFCINLTAGQQSPVTWEVGLVHCDGAFLLIGTQELKDVAQLQNEILSLGSDLSIAMRESVRKNRELKKASETIELLARTDALTGLANRRLLTETLPREIIRSERLQETLSVIFADLDHFKPINDQFGHLAGDQVLARLGPVLKRQLRLYDTAARYGGDEFVLLLPGSSMEAASDIAERIRKDVEALNVPECPRQITISLGVAQWTAGEAAMELIARADAALHNAKTNGGNRVENG
jgi:diguanylate cyclase (GGDEF)-like protein